MKLARNNGAYPVRRSLNITIALECASYYRIINTAKMCPDDRQLLQPS